MSKFIKKIVRALWVTLLVAMFALLAAFGVTQIPAAQRFAARKASAALSEALGVPVSVGRLRYVPFTTFEVANLTISDADSVPMISALRLKADVSVLPLMEGDADLREIDADSLSVLARQMPDGTLNLAALASDDTTAIPPFAIRLIKARRCEVRYADANARPIVLENIKIDASGLRNGDSGLGVSISDLSFFSPDLKARVALGGDFAMRGDTIGAGAARLTLGGCTAMVDTLLAVTDSAGLKMARIEIPRAQANGYVASRFFGADVPSVTFAMSAAYDRDQLTLNHLRLSVGKQTNAELHGVAKLTATPDGLNFERANATMTGWLSLADVKPFVDPDGSWPSVPSLPFNCSLMATATNASAAIGINSENGLVKVYANAESTDGWNVIDMNTQIDADLMPQGTLLGPLNRLVAQGFSKSRIVRNQANGDALRYVTLDGTIDRADVGRFSFSGIGFSGLFDGVAEPHEINGKVEVDDRLGRLTLVVLSQLSSVQPYVSLAAKADSVRLGELVPGLVSADRLLGFRAAGLETQGLDFASSLTNFTLRNLYVKSDTDIVRLDSVDAELRYADDGHRLLTLDSDVAQARATGDFDVAGLVRELREQASRVMPTLIAPPDKRKGKSRLANQQADLEADIFGVDSLVRIFLPDLHVRDTVSVRGRVDSQGRMLWASVRTRQLAYGGFSCNGLSAYALGNDGRADLSVMSDGVELPVIGSVPNDTIFLAAENDEVTADVLWTRVVKNDTVPGFLTMDAKVEADDAGRKVWRMAIDRSMLPVFDGSWAVDSCRMSIADDRVDVSNLYAFSGSHSVRARGSASASPADTMRLELNNIVLEDAIKIPPGSKYSLAGDLSLSVAASSLFSSPSVSAKAGIDRFFVDGDNLEHLDLSADYKAGSDSVLVDLAIVTGGLPRAVVAGGYYDMKADYLSLPFSIDSLSTGFLNFYLDNCIDSWKGSTSGNLALYGPTSDIKLDARLKLNDDNTFRVIQTDVSYSLLDNDSVILSPKSMDFKDVRFTDAKGRKGRFYGCIRHDMFSNLDQDLKFEIKEDIGILETDAKESPTYYGTISGHGEMFITGPTSNIDIEIKATTGKNTTFTVAPNAKSDIADPDFVAVDSETKEVVDLSEILGTGTTATLNLRITPDAKLLVVIDPKTGNQLSGRGHGDLTVEIERTGAMLMRGDYEIDEGNYNFEYLGVLDKQFTIDKGSKISWAGGPYDATLNVTATYSTKASLYPLVAGTAYEGSGDLKTRVPVDCKIHLTGELGNPDISFSIEIPSSQNFNQYAFDQYVNTQEEMQRQVFSLLTSSQFYSIQDAGQGNQSQAYLAQTASELASNKLSSLISNNEKNIGIGVNYRYGDETSNEEYAVSVSAQAFGDKVLLSGNIGYGRDVTGSSTDDGSVIGDFDVSVKLNDRGNIRAKAYTHSNNDVIYETSPTTQGIGISFQEEFDSFRELFRHYWRKLFHRRRAETENTETESDAEPSDPARQ